MGLYCSRRQLGRNSCLGKLDLRSEDAILRIIPTPVSYVGKLMTCGLMSNKREVRALFEYVDADRDACLDMAEFLEPGARSRLAWKP